jgi:hypothetical protein
MAAHQEIVAKLSAAQNIVNAADIPSDLRAVAFWQAFQALEGGILGTEEGSLIQRDESADENDLLAKCARRLNVSHDVVSAIFEQEGEGLQLIVPKGKLPNSNSKAASMRDIALLVAAGRQAAGLEDYTPLSIIREECAEFGLLDTNNFSTEIGRLGMRGQGGRNSREVRASRHQLEEAAELMSGIANT